jgi:hypothetical protein
MKRLLVGFVVATLLSLTAGGTSDAGATETVVNLLHGIGTGPNPVDVYIGEGALPTEWDLLAEDVQYGDYLDVGAFAPGGYNVLVCTAVAAPLDTITACADNATSSVNGNSGNAGEIPSAESATMLISFGGPDTDAPGRPLVSVWEDNLTCVDPGVGRLALNHAAASFPDPTEDMPVNGLVDGEIESDEMVWGDSGELDLDERDYEVEFLLAADDSLLADDPAVPVVSLQSTTAWLVGNPELQSEYAVLVTQLELEACPVTTTVPAPVTPAAPVQTARPTFTG